MVMVDGMPTRSYVAARADAKRAGNLCRGCKTMPTETPSQDDRQD
jgi:hypothetical protein